MTRKAKAHRVAALPVFFFLLFAPVWRAGTAEVNEWEKTLQAAAKEGAVTLYASDDFEIVFRQFQKRYPQIKTTVVTGRGNQIGERIMAERRAGKYLADVYLGGSGTAYNVLYEGKTLDSIKPTFILPEVVDESKWWSGKHIYHDDEAHHILAFDGEVQAYFGYNTKLVSPDAFTSYWDYLNPKWKGKIVSYDPTMGGAVSGVILFIYNNPDLGPEFIRRLLTEMELTATRDSRQLVDWLAVGKFSLSALSGRRTGLNEAARQGLPVSFFNSKKFKESAPLSTGNGNIAFFNRAPHPNAARVAINWLLSREGQMEFQKAIPEADSLRIDIPKETIPVAKRRELDGKYIILAGPGFKETGPAMQLVKELWKKKG
jgi:iron(III) transport system substrate-binding protein